MTMAPPGGIGGLGSPAEHGVFTRNMVVHPAWAAWPSTDHRRPIASKVGVSAQHVLRSPYVVRNG